MMQATLRPRGSRVRTDQVELRAATSTDVPVLATMNRQLIREEGSRNPMTPAELAARMREFLRTGWSADLIMRGPDVVGYLLYQVRRDEYVPARTEVYVRQFFVQPEYRRRGIGSSAFEKAAQTRFPAGATLALEALQTNPEAQRFWESLGFRPYCVTYRR